MISVKRLLGAYALAASMGLSSMAPAQETEPVATPESTQGTINIPSSALEKMKALYKEIRENESTRGVLGYSYGRQILNFVFSNPGHETEAWAALGISPVEFVQQYRKNAAIAVQQVFAEAEARLANKDSAISGMSHREALNYFLWVPQYAVDTLEKEDITDEDVAGVLRSLGHSPEQYIQVLAALAGEIVKELHEESQRPQNEGMEAARLLDEALSIFQRRDLGRPSELGGITSQQIVEVYQKHALIVARENLRQAKLPENAGKKALALMDEAGKFLPRVKYDELPEKVGMTALELDQMRSDNEVIYSSQLYQDAHNTPHTAEEKFGILIEVQRILVRNENKLRAKNPYPYDMYQEIGSNHTDFQIGLRVQAIDAIAEIITSFRARNVPFGRGWAGEEYNRIEEIFSRAQIDRSKEKTWEGNADAKAAWQSFSHDYFLNNARQAYTFVRTNEGSRPHLLYEQLTSSIPSYLRYAGYKLDTPESRAEAYKAIDDGLTEDVYKNLTKAVALPTAKEILSYLFEEKPILDLFEDVDQCLRDAGFNPDVGEGYDLIGITFEDYKKLRHGKAVESAKAQVAALLEKNQNGDYIKSGHISRLLKIMRIGGLDVESEEAYREIGTTKAAFESLKESSGYREPEAKPDGRISGIYRPKLVPMA